MTVISVDVTPKGSLVGKPPQFDLISFFSGCETTQFTRIFDATFEARFQETSKIELNDYYFVTSSIN